jgi:hypothetical protein
MQLAQLKGTIKGLFLAFGLAGLASCGSGDDATDAGGSCGGADESGICLQVSLIEPVNLDDQFTSDVDVNAVADCDPIAPGLQPEPFTEHFADITFSATLISGNPVAASFVQVTAMTVTFTQNTTDPVVGPAILQLTTPIDVVIPVGTSVTQNLSLMNFQRKNDYTPAPGFDIFTAGPFDLSGAPAFLSYNVRYFFSGEDEFGNNVDATAATEVIIGAYNNCA